MGDLEDRLDDLEGRVDHLESIVSGIDELVEKMLAAPEGDAKEAATSRRRLARLEPARTLGDMLLEGLDELIEELSDQ